NAAMARGARGRHALAARAGGGPTVNAGPARSSALPGVRLGRLVRHPDERGSFREVWRAGWYGSLDDAEGGLARRRLAEPAFVQANVSVSEPWVLRGLHLHRRQLDHWVVLDGRAFVALVDARPMLAGGGRPVVETHELAADDWAGIPPGVAHGFLALEPLTLLYVVTNEYDGTDELGFAWDDPDAAVPWPPVPTNDGRPRLSGRDEANPSLAELVASLRS
ncbi:MAG TPA: dTDP-4-dehydrorhamnose 3,5-epimerase family protein, partial [Candidatus Dormibacteraeota bacterium]|nr:dTDP-4-dehydrorhamnose 3,5-epimerase family protein [Candidatus Dormibacteraeota bacterium]